MKQQLMTTYHHCWKEIEKQDEPVIWNSYNVIESYLIYMIYMFRHKKVKTRIKQYFKSILIRQSNPDMRYHEPQNKQTFQKPASQAGDPRTI